MRKFLVLVALAAAFGFFLLAPEEKTDGLIVAEVAGFDDELVAFDVEEREPAPLADPIEGRVVRVDGEPVAGVRVVLEHAWVPEVSTLSRDDGTFRLTPSERRGALVVGGSGWLLLGGERDLTESRSAGYLLVVAEPATVRGKVVDPTGAPAAGARVTFRPPPDVLVPFGLASLPLQTDDQLGFTAADGSFALGPVPRVPRATIEVSQQGFELARAPFPAEPGSEVLIVLDPG